MDEKDNEQFIQTIVDFEKSITSEVFQHFPSFVCKAYRFPSTTKKIPKDEVFDLSSTRYHFFLRSGAEGEKLPPSKGAMKKREHIYNSISGVLLTCPLTPYRYCSTGPLTVRMGETGKCLLAWNH